MLRKLWLLSAPPDVSSVVSEEVSEVLVVVVVRCLSAVVVFAGLRIAGLLASLAATRLPHFAWHAMYCTIVNI